MGGVTPLATETLYFTVNNMIGRHITKYVTMATERKMRRMDMT